MISAVVKKTVMSVFCIWSDCSVSVGACSRGRGWAQHCGKTLSLSAFCLCSHLGDFFLVFILNYETAVRSSVTSAQTEKIIIKTRYVPMLEDSGSVEVGN